MSQEVETLSWKKRFVRRCPRILCVQILFLLLLSVVWWGVQAMPVVLSANKQPDLFYGTAHYASQSPILGRVTVRINNDDEARFLLWLDEEQRQVFDLIVRQGVPLEIVALRSIFLEWTVLALSSSEGGLDIEALTVQRWKMTIVALGLSLISILLWILVFRFYLKNYRGRKWF